MMSDEVKGKSFDSSVALIHPRRISTSRSGLTAQAFIVSSMPLWWLLSPALNYGYRG